MKLRPVADPFRLADDEIIVDLFAGGGGFSLGVEMATGRHVDVAANHDPIAVRMHEVNHPKTKHWIEDVRDLDPRTLADGRKVGLLIASPDCTDHSRAKNGQITRSKEIRCLANVLIDWGRLVRPRVFIMECVEELRDWGPLDKNGRPIRSRKGEEYQAWWARMEHLGYHLEEFILTACDYGAPTSRKRLFVIGRCDGAPIEMPVPTHGPGLLPYRQAAECINYGIPCPSIFLTPVEARQLEIDTGIRCKRPLVNNTKRRIGRGIYKHVLDDGDPFIIPVTHPGDQRVHDIREPVRTITGANRGELGIVAPTLVQTGYGERPGQKPRCLDIRTPLGAIMSGGTGGVGKHAVVAANLVRFNGQSGPQPMTDPIGTLDTRDRYGYVATNLVRFNGDQPGAERVAAMEDPLTTIDTANRFGMVAGFLTRNFSETKAGGWNGSVDLRNRMPTVTCTDHNSLTTSSLVKLRGTSDAHINASAHSVRSPLPTISANGYHFAEVRAFLRRFHDGVPIAKNQNYATVKIADAIWAIADIGFRMLVARELYRAQGFPDSYCIDPIFEYVYVSKNGNERVVAKPLTGKDQIEKCGNSVSPPLAAALVACVFPLSRVNIRETRWAA